MKVTLAKSAGFCFGVKRALAIALKSAAPGSRVYMLGDIVHNEDVVSQIEMLGIKKIKRLSKGKGRALLIRAHGESRKTLNKAGLLGYKIIDATCPMVKEIHKIARDMEKKGHKIIIIGDKEHDEVRGILGQLKRRALVIESEKMIPLNAIKEFDKAAIVVQSTQSVEKAERIASAIKPYIKNIKLFNTVCMPTRVKQEEIKKMPLENGVMIIIGSKNSANTKRLYEISKTLNRKTYWVSSKEGIRRGWFKGARSVGVTAGASTPDAVTREIIKYLTAQHRSP